MHEAVMPVKRENEMRSLRANSVSARSECIRRIHPQFDRILRRREKFYPRRDKGYKEILYRRRKRSFFGTHVFFPDNNE